MADIVTRRGDLLCSPSERVFVSIADAKATLAKAITLLDAKRVKDVASAMRVWARAQKDGQAAAQDAAEIVLRAERRLGQLSRELEKAAPGGNGGGAKVRAPDSRSKLSTLTDLGLSKQRASEYEKIASIPDDQFEASIRLARDEQKEITTAAALRLAGGGRLAKFSSESVEWYTPARYIDAARAALGGIDLDPASSQQANETVKAKRILTRDDDGLIRPWAGRIWLNPPYELVDGESSAGLWGAKLIAEYSAGRTTAAVLLVNAVTDAGWFRPLWDYPICFTDHRIEFSTPNGQPRSPVSGNAFAFFGSDVRAFVAAFSPFGAIVARVRP